MLLDHGANVNAKFCFVCMTFDDRECPIHNFYGPPLLKAVQDDFIDGIHLLLKYGANPDCFWNDIEYGHSTPPLCQAVMDKNLAVVSLLLDNGASVHMESFLTFVDEKGLSHYVLGSPLMKAVDDNFLEEVVLLLRHGANPLDRSSAYNNPLDLAIRKGYYDIIDVLSSAAVSE
ncbi:MAG: ankyrin repeat domain-containing protein [Parachlamydiaceae bacterium]|nr:ankyrin repeat domain-containing protein [Parachlamydiaceae bacterium]